MLSVVYIVSIYTCQSNAFLSRLMAKFVNYIVQKYSKKKQQFCTSNHHVSSSSFTRFMKMKTVIHHDNDRFKTPERKWNIRNLILIIFFFVSLEVFKCRVTCFVRNDSSWLLVSYRFHLLFRMKNWLLF